MKPTDVIDALSRRLADGDLEGALALYEPAATFAPQPGRQVSGLDEIRPALEQFIALKPTMTGTIEKVMEADGVALVVNRWALTGTGANVPTARSSHTAVWTGTEIIVWGGGSGFTAGDVNTGGRYNPSTDSWAASSLTTGSGATWA